MTADPLSPEHRKRREQESAISPAVIAARGYRTVTNKKQLATLGFSPVQRRVPGLLIPLFAPDGYAAGHQFRPDNPRTHREGKPVKYETPALLKQAQKPKELIGLGFPNSVATRVHRKLRQEKDAGQTKAPHEVAQGEAYLEGLSESSQKVAGLRQKPSVALNTAHSSTPLGDPYALSAEEVDNLVKALPQLRALMAAAYQLGTVRREICPHYSDALCIFEAWASKDETPGDMGELVMAHQDWTTPHCAPLQRSEQRLWYPCTRGIVGRVNHIWQTSG